MDKQKDPGESKGIEKLTIALRCLDDEKYEKMNEGFKNAEPYVFSLGFERNMRKLLRNSSDTTTSSFKKALEKVLKGYSSTYSKKFKKAKPHKFSKEFEASMRMLLQDENPANKADSKIIQFPSNDTALLHYSTVEKIREQARKGCRKKKIYYSLVSVASVIILIAIGINTQSNADRVPLVKMVTEQYADYIGVTVDLREGPTIDLSRAEYEVYEPSWIPKQYKIKDRKLTNWYQVKYVTKEGTYLYYAQYFDTDYTSRFDINTYSHKISINGTAYYYNIGKINSLMWIDSDTKFTHTLDSYEKIQILIKMSQKIQKIN